MKRGINLGCGNVILPGKQPRHHGFVPEFLYTDPDIQWDNVDWNPAPGVNRVVDLFDYPWREKVTHESAPDQRGEYSFEALLPESEYDYCLAAHIIEHIPHHIVERGQFVHRHPLYQDGWFAWFAQLWRVMKPGGKVWLVFPYAWSNSGVSDPTHCRYITPATINYFNNATDEAPEFRYRQNQRWDVNMRNFAYFPHELGVKMAEPLQRTDPTFNLTEYAWRAAQTNVNMIADCLMDMTAVKE